MILDLIFRLFGYNIMRDYALFCKKCWKTSILDIPLNPENLEEDCCPVGHSLQEAGIKRVVTRALYQKRNRRR